MMRLELILLACSVQIVCHLCLSVVEGSSCIVDTFDVQSLLPEREQRVREIHDEFPVPFYLYEDEDALNFGVWCKDDFERMLRVTKHCASEFIVHKRLQLHRWRTRNPEQAQLFIVPAYIGTSSRGACAGAPSNHADRMVRLAEFLAASPYYQKHGGADHMIINQDFIVNRRTMGARLARVVRNFIWGHFEGGRGKEKVPWRCTVVVPYDDIRVSVPSNATIEKDFEMRAEALAQASSLDFNSFLQRKRDFVFVGQADDRPGYQARAAYLTAPTTVNNRNYVAGVVRRPALKKYGPVVQQPSSCTPDRPEIVCTWLPSSEKWNAQLKDSLFSLMFRGDSSTSGRLYDAIMRDTLSVIVSDDLPRRGLPFQCLVPWGSLAVQVKEHCFTSAANDVLSEVGNMPLSRVKQIWETMRRFKQDLLWNVPGSRVVDNVLLTAARSCLPENLAGGLVRMPCVFRDHGETSP